MNRRDTIIIAVLVNAALLMILFVTAVRSGGSEPEKKKQAAQVQLVEAKTEESLIGQYATSIPTIVESQTEPISFSEEFEFAFIPPQPIEEVEVEKAPQAKGHFVDVVVKKGDFLEKIANANNTNVAAIMKANHLTSTQLNIGQVLKVPILSGKLPEKSSVSKEEYYIVKDGDNPWLIASRNHICLEDLLRLNGLDEHKARRLRPGDRLRIR